MTENRRPTEIIVYDAEKNQLLLVVTSNGKVQVFNSEKLKPIDTKKVTSKAPPAIAFIEVL